MKLRSCFFLLILAAILAGAQEQTQPPTVFRSNVNLVNVFCTVLDANGSPVADLEKTNFEVFEDNLREDIAFFSRESELPLSIILAVDTSLSTHKDLPVEMTSARRFVHTIMRQQDALSLYQFDKNVRELVHFSNNLSEIDRGLDRVRPGTSTSMYDAIFLAGESLRARRGRKVLVVITDGGDTTSTTDYQGALRSVIESEALVYSIIVVPIEASAGRDTGGEHALIQMSRDTGGKYYYASSAGELDRVFRQIDRELRTQYLLSYYPKPHHDYAEFRRIEVKVHVAPQQPAGAANPAPVAQYSVRHRVGYYPYRAVRDSE
jgi:Ca-activated chloride channel family protein